MLYEKFRLAWINDLGAFDYFNFNLASKETQDIVRSTFRKKRGVLTGTSFSATDTARGLSTFDTNVTKTYSVVSDWITEAEAEWLAELFRSQQVFWFVETPGTAGFRPITILDKSYTVGKKNLNKNINVSISFAASWDVNVNRS